MSAQHPHTDADDNERASSDVWKRMAASYLYQLKRVRTAAKAAMLIRAWGCYRAATSDAPAEQLLGVIRECERQAGIIERLDDVEGTTVHTWLSAWGYR